MLRICVSVHRRATMTHFGRGLCASTNNAGSHDRERGDFVKGCATYATTLTARQATLERRAALGIDTALPWMPVGRQPKPGEDANWRGLSVFRS